MSLKERSTVCSPIRTLSDLFNLSSSCLTSRLKCSQLVSRYTSPRQKILLCHDMKGGYLEDKHTQGCQTDESCYRFFRWHLIDMFVYFAHELVTIPPVVWIDCAHKNGVQILGTFITEFDKGKEICRQLLSSDHVVNQVVDALVLLMKWYSFDGYLLNIENPIEPEHIERLLSFVSKLKLACSEIDRNSIVLWYDSVTKNGDLKWQNQLNELNESFFNACDGIFLNYTWKSEMLLQSKINAGQRYRDVFVGIDVFGRGCFGGGGFNTSEAISLSHKMDLSTAIFAPGWLFETLDAKQFIENDRKFWTLLEPYTNQRTLHLKSLTTYFSDGCGEKFFLHGLEIANNSWYNLSLQSYLPNSSSEHIWSLKYDDAYFGGSYLELHGDAKGYLNLFRCCLPMKSRWEAIIVFKGSDDVMLELECDDGKLIPLDQSEEDLVIRDWKRKTYRLTANEQLSIINVSIRDEKNANTIVKLGYLSIHPVESPSLEVSSASPLIKSIEYNSNVSITVNFVDFLQEHPSSMIFVFVRDQFERYTFLGATHQSYFVIFRSTINSDKPTHSTLILRQYLLNSFILLSEQTLSISLDSKCLKGFCPEKSS
ncbi:unnamed protein product [Adineta ricciae]|uniref:Cytosolic endo-beta-N-acetylglucosaminidase n=1 Tax=Adineta ricciae TaxID=249248 RepID=A0A813PSJ0_ADIRI|nr:unnamed protein product [Adineta ricciae]